MPVISCLNAKGGTGKTTSAINLAAVAAGTALVAAGIAAERLSAEGFGDSRPVADNSTAEGKAKNRRVELVRQ